MRGIKKGILKGTLMNHENTVATTTASWFDKLKHSVNITTLKEIVNKQKIAEIALYLGVGFLCGFLIKRYAHLIVLVILAIIGGFILQQMGLIAFVINWEKMQNIFGIVQTSGQPDWLAAYWSWVTLNWAIVASFTIGLLGGLKLG